ncbi:hypothetical protein [Providencia stuartii]|uniref:hypothetical protein n=2 Tax=Providencia stuartii TaxID=588 RepID=UPI00300D7845
MNRINNNITALYAQSEDIEEAMSIKFVDISGKIHEENFWLLEEDKLETGAWSGNLDEDASISMFIKDSQTIFILNLSSTVTSAELYEKLKELFISVNINFELMFFNVNYPSANIVYPDRPSTSWMLFIKDTNFSEAKIDQAEVIEDIEKDGVKIGELLITTKNYDPKNIHHQNRSNDIDILLLGYHLLPKYKEIYVK